MSRVLSGRVALITGAGRGIGKAFSKAFALEGASLVLMSRTATDIESLAREIESNGGSAIPVAGDVSNSTDAERVVSEAIRSFQKIDILVNNAGIRGSTKSLEEITDGEWDEVMKTNVSGAFFMTREALPYMLERKSGNIINMSSGAGQRSLERIYVLGIPYAVSKFAVEGFTYALAVKLRGTGINVNAIRPGATRTSIEQNMTRDESGSRSWSQGEFHEPGFASRLAIYLAALSPGERTGESFSAEEWNDSDKK